ncbi:hypothetical protein ABK040_014758 [Willaertia magna]
MFKRKIVSTVATTKTTTKPFFNSKHVVVGKKCCRVNNFKTTTLLNHSVQQQHSCYYHTSLFTCTLNKTINNNEKNNESLDYIQQAFFNAKTLPEMRECLIQLQTHSLSTSSSPITNSSSSATTTNTTTNNTLTNNSNFVYYIMALNMAMKENSIQDVRMILDILLDKNSKDFEMIDVYTLRELILFFARYYKEHPLELQTRLKTRSQQKPTLNHFNFETIEFLKLFYQIKLRHAEYLNVISPIVIASAMICEQWRFAGVVLCNTIDSINNLDNPNQEEEILFGNEELSEKSKEIMKVFIESLLKIIIKKVKQNMIKLSVYTSISDDGLHISANEDIYKETCLSIMEGLHLGLNAINFTNNQQAIDALDEEICAKFNILISVFQNFIDSSQHLKLKEKSRKLITSELIKAEDFLSMKTAAYKERLATEHDPSLQFRVECKFNIQEDGNVKGEKTKTYFNENALNSGNTLIINKFQPYDNNSFKFVVEGRAILTNNNLNNNNNNGMRGNNAAAGEDLLRQQQRKDFIKLANNYEKHLDEEEQGLYDRDFW